jgi:murein L,D-transpeptidase YafK
MTKAPLRMPVNAETSKRSNLRRAGRAFAMASLVILVVVAALLTPWAWRLARDGDEALIELTRAERLWRASVGMAMPGAPDLSRLPERLAQANLKSGAPIFMRIFKREFELELWMLRGGAFHLFATYPICRWSGTLGPKLAEGDRQAPEGVYSVDKSALNPNSQYRRSFNLGYPNAYDRALNRTGSLIMVHGACASVGCFAMTDPQIDEIWSLVTAALDGGQRRFQVQVLPFRMTRENLDHAKSHSSLPFWRQLKIGSDMFDASLLPPRVAVCGGGYRFERSAPNGVGDGGIETRCAANATDAS